MLTELVGQMIVGVLRIREASGFVTTLALEEENHQDSLLAALAKEGIRVDPSLLQKALALLQKQGKVSGKLLLGLPTSIFLVK